MGTIRVTGVQVLRQMALGLRSSPDVVRRDAARRLQARYKARLTLQFGSGTDPYGRPWPSPKDGHRPPMVRTGKLSKGYLIVVVVAGSGLSLAFTNKQFYSEYLQKGTERMDARIQVPTADRPLPDEWLEDRRASYQEALDAWFRRFR